MDPAVPVSIRAIFLTPEDSVLLMEIEGRAGNLWITPGGRVEPGEAPLETLAREVREETGLGLFEPEREVWVRHGYCGVDGRRVPEREHFYLIRTDGFEPDTREMGAPELRRFLRFKWWSISEILDSHDHFAPRRMGELLDDLRTSGPPPEPVETGA